MWKGRELISCTLAFMAGNMLGSSLSLPPLCYLLLSLSAAFASLRRPRPLWLLASMFLLGAAGVQAGRMPGLQPPSALAEWAACCKFAFSSWLGTLLPEGDELSLLRALSIADRSGLTHDLREAWRRSGAMHLLALSGLHVGLIYAMLLRLLAPLGGGLTGRLLRSTVILTLLWTYALVTGLSPSIVRAALMISFYELSMYVTGGHNGLQALAGSALLLMLFRPEVLRDIGFQLSYTAVLSIMLLHPWLKSRLQSRFRLLIRVWELLSVSLCCQATCGVLAWLYFGTFPRYFLLTTLLAIPLTAAVMYAAAVALAFAGLSSLAIHLLSGSAFSIDAITSDSLPAVSRAILSISGILSETSAVLLHRLLHLLNTLIRLIADL